MREHQVQIKETLAMTVTVEADNAVQAIEVVKRRWKNGDYILDADHFQGAVFTVPMRQDRER